MELAREERKLQVGPLYGHMLAERMRANEGKPERMNISVMLRELMAKIPPSSESVDLTTCIQQLGEEDLWNLARHCTGCHTINLAGWQAMNQKKLRCISLALGDRLDTVDFSRTPIDNTLMQVFTSRLFALRSLSLASCPKVCNTAVRTVADACNQSLTSLDISKCDITSDAIGWLAATIGYGRPACAKLRSLNAFECTRINDNGPKWLAIGCPALRFLNMSSCALVTDKGICALARGCPQLRVLNTFCCPKVTDRALKMLGKHCHRLSSLNVGRCVAITDRGLSGLAKGCPNLQCLNLAGCKLVTEGGLCRLAKSCPGLQTMNLTGCNEVTENGLRALVDGLDFVERAHSFFGFVPVRDATAAKLVAAQGQIEDRAMRRIFAAFTTYKMRLDLHRRFRRRKERIAVFRIERVYLRHVDWQMQRRRFLARRSNMSALEIQRCWRGMLGRVVAGERRARHQLLLTQLAVFIKIQAFNRGRFVRKFDTTVKLAVDELYEQRFEEAKQAAAVRIQGPVRMFLAKRKALAVEEEVRQRWRDKDFAARQMQGEMRVFLAKQRAYAARVERQRMRDLHNKAASRIQAMYRGSKGKYSVLMKKHEIEKLMRLRNKKALMLQRVFRGHVGREQWRARKYEFKMETKAATAIQSFFRGTRILRWPEIKFNRNAAFIRQRQELELLERMRCAEARNLERIEGALHDSASDPDDEEQAEDNWVECWDDQMGRPFWYNQALNERTYDMPEPFAFELGLIGKTVKIFWPQENEWFNAVIEKYNKTKKRHCVQYEDGDHEWIDLVQEQARVIIFWNDQWTEFRLYAPPELQRERERTQNKAAIAQETKKKKEDDLHWVQIWDEGREKSRWMNEKTGELRWEADDIADWEQCADQAEREYWHNMVTDEVTYDRDPRFEPEQDSAETVASKERVLSDIRFAMYFMRILLQEFASAATAREAKVARENIRTGEHLKRLGAVVAEARTLFGVEAFAEGGTTGDEENGVQISKELHEAEFMLKRCNEIEFEATLQHWQREEWRKDMIKGASPTGKPKAFVCKKCGYECPPSLKFCSTCGEKLT